MELYIKSGYEKLPGMNLDKNDIASNIYNPIITIWRL